MFENITKVTIPKSIISKTFDFLQYHGKYEKESHAILAGLVQDKIFNINNVLFPKQNNSDCTYEVLDGADHELNVQLYKLGIVAIAQIHTHPKNAFHSYIDDEGASLLIPGSFSIVIPDYGYIDSTNIDNWAVYRYLDLKWKWISNHTKKKIFVLCDHVV